jgi:hypothetical protein
MRNCSGDQFLKVRQAHPANIELAQRRLADCETCDSQVVDAIPAAVQESRRFQIRQKTVDRTHRQPRLARDLFRSEPLRRLAEQLQKTQPTLQRRDVVASFLRIRHERPRNFTVTK